MISLFIGSAFFCIYTYAIFPLLLHWRANSKQSESVPANGTMLTQEASAWPSVSVVIAIHNEASRLDTKINSLLALDYPQELLQIVFVSDGSTDNSVALIQARAQETPVAIDVHHYENASGKPTALNAGVEIASGDVIVFMDARQTVSSNAVKALVMQLHNESVGAVSGELVLSDGKGTDSKNVGLYWKYEKWIRQNESALYSTTGATGALYAIRKQHYLPHRADVLLDDFDTPVSLLKQGLRTVFEPEAQVFDQAEANASGEFKRKARTLAGNFQSFSRNKWLFNPSKNPIFWQFISHKVCRLLVPYAMLLALLASLFGNGAFLNAMLVVQCVFYGLGLYGFLRESSSRNKVVNFIKVFLQLNAAAVVGAVRYFSGNANVRWKQA